MKIARSMAQYWGEVTRRLADDYVLHYNVDTYSVAIEDYANDILERYGDLMTQNDLGLGIGNRL